MKPLLYFLFSMAIITSCTKTSGSAPSAEEVATEKTLLNEPYGGDTAQKMDIYLPAGRSREKTKAIVLIHGGSWTSGNKSDLNYYIDTFKKRLPDYAIFNINYRLVSRAHHFSVQEEDIRLALEFIHDGADAYAFNKDAIVLLGVSAGAHLALLQAYKNPAPKVSAVIDFFGPTDLIKMYNEPWHPMIPFLIQSVTGTTPADNPDLFRNVSPVYFVTDESPATLILHGGKDNIVNISQSRLLKQKLDAAGVPNELLLYPDEGHGWYGPNLTHSFNKIGDFLEAHVQ